jgi:hypothetical protein
MRNTTMEPAVSDDRDRYRVAPASYAQERVWFASQLARGMPVYNVVTVVRLPHRLTADRIRAALAHLCDRHETLRTSFRMDDGRLVQLVHARIDLPLSEVDLSQEPAPAQEQRITELLDEMAYAQIPLDRAPLWRATLVRRDQGPWCLLTVAHHTVTDAQSLLNLERELNEICAAELTDRAPGLPALRIQYADYAAWQRSRLSGGGMEQLLPFWRTALAGLPIVHELRTDRPRPAERGFAGADVVFPLPDRTTALATELARRAGATPFMVLLAAWAALLHRLSGQSDIVIGVPVAGRDMPELQPLIGMFVNVVVIRVDASGDPPFVELLGRLRRTVFDALDHQEMPFQRLVEDLATHRRAGVPPLYQIAFNYTSVGFSRLRSATTEDDLALEVVGDEARLEYNTALFDESTAREVAACYQRVLTDVLSQPAVRMSALRVRSQPAALAGPPESPPAPEAAPRSTTRPDYVAPRTAAEELVAAVWSEVLGVDRIGALDDFFDLGGHSLLALRVIARLSAAAEIELTIHGFFAGMTVAGVAAEVERVLAAELDELPEDEAERLAAEER